MKPISNTAFYCCGVRIQDAENENSMCGDIYAQEFMDERGLNIFSSFKAEKNPNAGNVARHRIIDDYLRKALLDNPELSVFMIGAGFDSRAYRLDGGSWIELDEPQIIAYKNERLPIEQCQNKLQRISIDFETESLADKLRPFATERPVTIIFEGAFIYLPEDIILQTLRTLQSLFPKHTLACDLMTGKFYKKYSHSLGQKIGNLGAGFMYTSQQPTEVFCNANYRIAEIHSVIGKAIELGAIRVPWLIFRAFLKTLERGYSIYIFEAGR